MIQNYLKIAWRNLVKNKIFSLTNIFGLAIGIATCLIIMLFVQDELSFDRFNEKANQIVRIVFKANINGGKINESNVMPPTARTLKSEYAEVLDATRLRTSGTPRVVLGEKIINDATLAYADSNFFDVFTLPFLKGNPKTALNEPNFLVLTQKTAERFFGKENPLGKRIYFNKNVKDPYKITGVIADIPQNSHFHFDMFGSLASDPEAKSTSWMSSNYYTYLVLPKGYDYKKLEAKLPQMVEKHMGPEILKAMGMTVQQFRSKGNELGFGLQKLTDIHFNSASNFELEPSGDKMYVYIFGIIALFMLLIACINFMNLLTAGASKRAKEVGVRKVMGSVKSNLIGQFLIESILLTAVALILAIVLVQLFMPAFNQLSGKNLNLNLFSNPQTIFILLGLGLLIGLLAGSYPALFLSSFKPIMVLKGKLNGNKNSIGLRQGLVVFQFCISVCLIIGTTIVYLQIHFIQNKKLGYDQNQLLVLQNSWALGKNETVYKQQLLKDSRVVNVTTSPYKPAGPTNSNNSLAYPEADDSKLMRTLQYGIDDQYIPTMGMQMVDGRNFSKEFSADSAGIIINEAAAKAFGWGNKAVGHKVTRVINNDGQKKIYQVIGVVKDFHFKSLHEAITPLLMVYESNWGLIVKVKTKDMAGLLGEMKTQWQNFGVEEPFNYAFMDELVNKTYEAEQKTSKILTIFAGLTIFIACLGLFGLANFTAEQRTKEIGVRKVLGANVSQIVTLLSKEFVKLILIACVFAFPISWWAMHRWLQDFAYRIDISVWIFVFSGISAISIALLTVGYQAIKAALMNPVKSLKTE
jgi:putative ABC transport system permease protein